MTDPHLPLGPEPPPDPTTGLPRHRVFGPLPTHTDACIADAARYGFCDHTRLTVRPHLVHRKAELIRRARRTHFIREFLAALGLACIFGPFLALSHELGFLKAAPIFALLSLGWLLVFTCGLPRFMTEDPRDWIPPDVATQLRGQIAPDSKRDRRQ